MFPLQYIIGKIYYRSVKIIIVTVSVKQHEKTIEDGYILRSNYNRYRFANNKF